MASSMYIVFAKDSERPRAVPASLALAFFQTFRSELWRQGVMRDPKAGDCVLGVRIVSLTR